MVFFKDMENMSLETLILFQFAVLSSKQGPYTIDT